MLARLFMTLPILLACSLATAAEAAESAHDFAFDAIEGHPLPLSSYEGKVVLVVNTASLCGFTPQYADLQAIWERYRDRGFVVLGVPSNDFGNQEPGGEDEIKMFCEINYDIDFPMTGKVQVKGEDAHPFYKWAAGQAGPAGTPRWNFHKYLIGPEGDLVTWFSTPTEPTSREVADAIEAQLARAEASGG
jgi:glutathione peroxidase